MLKHLLLLVVLGSFSYYAPREILVNLDCRQSCAEASHTSKVADGNGISGHQEVFGVTDIVP